MNKLTLIIIFALSSLFKINAQEEKVISLYIYNFTRYIEWPEVSQGDVFTIDVIGHKSVYDKLKEYTASRKVGAKNIQVRFIESINGITKSDILFVGFWQSKDIAKVLEKVGTANTLIIGEKDGLIENGVGINFVIRGETIKFDMKPANIQKQGLKISNELTQLANKVY